MIDQLPQDIIQHVKTSNNPAITAALDAAIQREQSFGQQRQGTSATFNVQGSNAIRHVAQHNEAVQDSRPASSSESASSSSSEVSSSEESDSEELQAAFPSKF